MCSLVVLKNISQFAWLTFSHFTQFLFGSGWFGKEGKTVSGFILKSCGEAQYSAGQVVCLNMQDKMDKGWLQI